MEKTENKKSETFKYKCHRCRKIGHKAAECKEKVKRDDKANCADTASLYVIEDETCVAEDCTEVSNVRNARWCLDSSCTAHLCNSENKFAVVRLDEER